MADDLDVVLLHVSKPRCLFPTFGLTSFINLMPFGLISLASRACREGARTEIVHTGIERHYKRLAELPRYIRERNVRVVGISLHWHHSTFDALEIGRWIRDEVPGVPIVYGGMTASVFAEQMLELPFVDYVVQGEGEEAFAALVRSLLRGEGEAPDRIPNVWTRNGDGTPQPPASRHTASADELAGYDFSRFELVRGAEVLPYLGWTVPVNAPWMAHLMGRALVRPVTSYLSRGCMSDCPTCGGNRNCCQDVMDRKRIFPMPPAIIRDVFRKAKSFGFNIVGSSMGYGLSEEYFLELFDVVRREHLDLAWTIESPGIPPLSAVRSLKTATTGGAEVVISADSGAERVRDIFRDAATYSNQELIEWLEALDAESIPVHLFFSQNLPLDAEMAELHWVETDALKQRLKRFKKCTTYNMSLELDPASRLFARPGDFECEVTWQTLRDYYEAHRSAANGNGYTIQHPFPRQLPFMDNRGFQVGVKVIQGLARLERGVRETFTGRSSQEPYASL